MPTRSPWIMLLMLAAFAALPLLWPRSAFMHSEVLVLATFAMGYNLLLGTTGLPSFGHGAFFGIGAYALGLMQLHVAPGLWLGLAGAVLASALAGALVSAFTSHRRGIYFSLLTIAFGQAFWFVAMKWTSLTGGEDGLLNLARPPVALGFADLPLDSNASLYWLCLAVFTLVVLGLWRLIDSPFGKALQAVRQNELRATFVGYPVRRLKAASFTISAAIAGLAGGLYALLQESAYPNVMDLHHSGNVVMMVLIGGGMVSFLGPVLGAVIFVLAQDLLSGLTDTWMLWYGLMFMVVVLFKPEGLAGLLRGEPAAQPAPVPAPAPAATPASPAEERP